MRSARGRSATVTAIVAFVALFLALPLGARAGGSVRFLSPANLGFVLDKVKVEVAVEPPPGATVTRVVLRLDGTLLARIESPPWSTVWDAGEGLSAHRIEAIAYFSDGTDAHETIRISPFRADFVENVDLVNVYAVVRDSKGGYVQDLKKEDFRVFENGKPETIDQFDTDWKKLRVAVVLDTSLSMKGGRLEAAQEAALDFLKILKPDDEAHLVTFSDTVQFAQTPTTDRKAIAEAIRRTTASGGTALYDAVYDAAADLMKGRPEIDGPKGDEPGKDEPKKDDVRRVIVLLSDGRDEAASGLEPGSLHTLPEALDRALRSEVMIFTVGVGHRLDAQMDFEGRQSLEAILKTLAENTGGRAILSPRSWQIRKAFDAVAQELRHQYTLAYEPDDARHDGTWREIRVTVTKPGLKATTRRGYYAPTEGVLLRAPSRKK